MDLPGFVISPSQARSMAESESESESSLSFSSSPLPLPTLLLSLVRSAQTLARPPISNYYVAAVGLGSSGRIFIGVNLEFPGLPLHYSVHAEQFLVANLLQNAEPRLLSFAVSAAPCGHCRQFFQELRHSGDIQVLFPTNNDSNNHRQFTPLSDLLPSNFGPYSLLPESAPLLLEPHHNKLTFPCNELPLLPHGECNGHGLLGNKNVRDAALEAANQSHAPYSGSPSGAAIVDSKGRIYKGSYVESAAFNPSLGPVQAALVAFVAGGGGDYGEIVGAVLVEMADARVRQNESAKLLLQTISPECEILIFGCVSDSDAKRALLA